MARFVFRLDSVLRHRRMVERERMRVLAVAQSAMNQLRGQMSELERTVREAGEEMRNSMVGTVDLQYLAAHRRFIVATQRQGVVLAQRMTLAQREIDDARSKLAEAAKQRKILEKLRERQQGRWVEEQARKDASATDEVGMHIAFENIAMDDATIEQVGDVEVKP